MDKTYYKLLLLLVFIITLSSCNFGPKPDKIIRVNVALEEVSESGVDINTIIETLRKRMEKVSIVHELRQVEGKNQIYIEVATDFNSERVTELIINPGKIAFYETYGLDKVMGFFAEVNSLSKKESDFENPLYDLFKNQGYQGGAALFYATERDTSKVNTLLTLKSAKALLPNEGRYAKFLWGIKEKNSNQLPLYLVKLNRQLKPAITGEVIQKSYPAYDQLNRPVINIQMNEEGAKLWEDLTGKAFEERSQIAMVIDNLVYSAPGVSAGPIIGGASQISGDFTVEEAQDLSYILNSGAIPQLKLLDMDVEKLAQ